MNTSIANTKIAITSLQKNWYVFLGTCVVFILAGFIFLITAWLPEYAIRWMLMTGAVAIYQLWLVRKNLAFNHRIGEDILLPGLGLGNAFTLLRGMMFAGLTGFLFAPRPPGGLAWIPALLYTAGALIDYIDGYAARITNRVTKLGEILDMSMDGWGMLVASFLAVQYGQVPVWYILVGLARYLYLAGLWLLNRLGKTIYDLPPSNIRRPFAGLQMGFAFVMLWPLFSPPGTHIAAVVFSLPFLLGFARDWLVVSGWVGQDFIQPVYRLKRIFIDWLPVVVRLGVFVTVLWLESSAWTVKIGSSSNLLLDEPQGGVISVFFISAVDLLISLSLLLGFAGRIMAIAGMIVLGIYQAQAPLMTVQIGLLWAYGMLLYLGSGRFSVWKPEDRLIFRRAGE